MTKNQIDKAYCVYCGIEISDVETENEHVLPKSLFEKPYPKNMAVVPSCGKCNDEKSKDDDYLRDMLISDIRAYESPVARRLFQKMLRSVKRNSSHVARGVDTSNQWVAYNNSSVISPSHAPVVPLDEARVHQIFDRITRGLFYYHKQQRLADNIITTVRFPRLNEDLILVLDFFEQASAYKEPINPEVVIYLAALDNIYPGHYYWFFWFYKSIPIFVETKY